MSAKKKAPAKAKANTPKTPKIKAPRALRLPKPKKPATSFSLAVEVRAVAQRLIHGTGASIPGVKNLESDAALPGMVDLRDVEIAYLFTTADSASGDDPVAAAKFAIKHLPLVERAYTFEVIVSRPRFFELEETERYALVYAGLLRCGRDEKGKPTIVDPDYTGFEAHVRHFGLVDRRARQMALQMSLFKPSAGMRAVK